MEYKMGFLIFILCVIPAIVTSITISPNGNSPEVKMLGGMMVDIQKGFTPIPVKVEATTAKSNYEKSRKIESNSTRLSLNERYRRLIPYMTFYYANDLVTPTTEAYRVKSIEVEKAEIVEARQLGHANQRQPKKIYSPHRNIPRYQGNRLTHYNIASANPIKIYYKDNVPVYHSPSKPAHIPSHSEYVLVNNNYNSGRQVLKQITKPLSIPFSSPTRKPYFNIYQNDDTANIRYYLAEKEQAPKYKLVPYEQTPPVKVAPQSENIYEHTNKPIPIPVLIPKDHVYIKPRPIRPNYYYEDGNVQQVNVRKPTTEIDNYFEKQHLQTLAHPLVESGFKPIINRPAVTTEIPIYTSTAVVTHVPEYENQRQHEIHYETESLVPVSDYKPNEYQYDIEQPTYNKPAQYTSDTINLANLLNTLQLNKAIPKPITRANVGSSIKTLLQVLNALKATQQNDLDVPVLSTPKPFVANHKIVVEAAKPTIGITPSSIADEEFNEEPYLAPANPPSQHLDDYPTNGGSSQQFPLPVTSDDEGGTPGQPGVDYPILTTIPETSFDCKTQRYKGFFADTETRCQVWHYCDLNGGQASFLCPNGTIFSQAGLTCDWWFNVKCDDTTQLYVLNESLYKYILPHSPTFPEDYSGPLVDKYLTLKFKEMEEEFKKNKNKQSAASEKMDSDDNEDSNEEDDEKESESDQIKSNDQRNASSVSEASVIVESPGTSGNVERLNDNL